MREQLTIVRASAVLAAMSAAGCLDNPPPEVTILSPKTGALISDYDPIDVDVVVTEDDELAGLSLLVDGQQIATLPEESLPTEGQCRRGCALGFTLFTAELTEADHSIVVVAEDDRGASGGDQIAIAVEDAPALALTNPVDGADMAGAGQINVLLAVVDRSPLDISIDIDGQPAAGAPTQTTSACGLGCSLSHPWSTLGYEEGPHTLDIRVVDPFGREASATATVEVADIVYLSGVEVTGEDDGNDRLELEVHLYDAATNSHLGCSGQDNGLEDADWSDIRYMVDGRFDGTASVGLLRFSEVAERSVYARVIEDDDFRCPSPPGGGDDSIGTSAAFAGSDIPTMPPMQFGAVVYLDLNAGRPLVR